MDEKRRDESLSAEHGRKVYTSLPSSITSMKVGVLTAQPLGHMTLPEALGYLESIGVDAVELPTGGFVGDDHLPRGEYLGDENAQADLIERVEDHGIEISGLAVHANPVHPVEERAAAADRDIRESIRLADQLGVDRIITFSGLPAGGPSGEVPNWITAPWPPEHHEALQYQWDVTIDYWEDAAAFADDHGVDVAIEMHPNMLVYEPRGMMKLREATNDRIGANIDPSHLWWQQIDVTRAIRYLGERNAIHYFHAKDTKVYAENAGLEGVLDTKPYGEEADRSWLFRSVGYGHDEEVWRDIASTLRMVGYDDVMSIEWEDSLAEPTEGLEKAVAVLQDAVFEREADREPMPG